MWVRQTELNQSQRTGRTLMWAWMTHLYERSVMEGLDGLFWTLILSNYTDDEISDLSRWVKWYEDMRFDISERSI